MPEENHGIDVENKQIVHEAPSAVVQTVENAAIKLASDNVRFIQIKKNTGEAADDASANIRQQVANDSKKQMENAKSARRSNAQKKAQTEKKEVLKKWSNQNLQKQPDPNVVSGNSSAIRQIAQQKSVISTVEKQKYGIKADSTFRQISESNKKGIRISTKKMRNVGKDALKRFVRMKRIAQVVSSGDASSLVESAGKASIRAIVSGVVKFFKMALRAVWSFLRVLLAPFAIYLCILVPIIVVVAMLATDNINAANRAKNQQKQSYILSTNFPADVEQWRAFVTERCSANNDPNSDVDLTLFVDAILTTIYQESAGKADAAGVNGDVMQCSAAGSYWNKEMPAEWTDAQRSIDVGTRVFYDLLKKWNVTSASDVDGLTMVAQGYNYGSGFLDWSRKKGYEKWSLDISTEFSNSKGGHYGTKSYGSQWAAKLEASAVMIDSSMIAGGEYLWAVDASHVEVTSFFGRRQPTVSFASKNHLGIDFNVGANEPVYAIAEGIVTAKAYSSSMGNYVSISTQTKDGTLVHTYMHNNSFANITVGQKVAAGQQIAYAGSTGNSTGVHCHLRTQLNGLSVNPLIYCYGGITNIKARDSSGNIMTINLNVNLSSDSWSARAGTAWNTYYMYTADGYILGTGKHE